MRVSALGKDIKFAARMFAGIPGFTSVAITSLALGLGANAAMFSLVNALLLRPLPYRDPAKLVRLEGVYPRAAAPFFGERSRTSQLAAVDPPSEMTLEYQGRKTRLTGSAVSSHFFDILGVPVELGRGFKEGEDSPGADRLVVISHKLWTTRFRGDRSIVGQLVSIDGVSREIVGVAPEYLSYPSPAVQLWLPLRLDPARFLEYWGDPFVTLVGRLRPQASLAGEQAEVRELLSAFRKTFPYPMSRDWNANASSLPLQRDITGDIRGKLLLLLASAGTVLLIACANQANMLLMRAISRRKELALRLALGADRERIRQQLITESVLLSLAGALVGLVVASAMLPVFKAVLSASTPGLPAVGIDWEVVLAIVGLALACGAALGLVLAASTLDVRLAEVMKSGSHKAARSGWVKLRGFLVSAEVALALLLLVSAGLLLRSMGALMAVQPGFNAVGLIALPVNPNPDLCRSRAGCVAFYDKLLASATKVHGVLGEEIAEAVPLDGQLPTLAVDIEGHPKTADQPAPVLAATAVSPGYFSLLRITLLAGRTFANGDVAGAPLVCVVSAATAKHFWPHESALGKHIRPANSPDWRAIVGVVGDVKQYSLIQGLPEWIPGALYLPYTQSVRQDGRAAINMKLLIKTDQEGPLLEAALQRMLQEQLPDQPSASPERVSGLLQASTGSMRATMRLFGAFAAIATILAGIGIYGLIAYWVSQRTYEIGVRTALGASRYSIIGMVFRQGLQCAGYGILCGLLLALTLTRLLRGLLFGVTPTDPLTFLETAVLLVGIAAVAAALPAGRAARIEASKSLRTD